MLIFPLIIYDHDFLTTKSEILTELATEMTPVLLLPPVREEPFIQYRYQVMLILCFCYVFFCLVRFYYCSVTGFPLE